MKAATTTTKAATFIAAIAVALMAVTGAVAGTGPSTSSLDPWAVNAVRSSQQVDPWALNLIRAASPAASRTSTATLSVDPWALNVIRAHTHSTQLDPWAVNLVRDSQLQSTFDAWAVNLVRGVSSAPAVHAVAVRSAQPSVAVATGASGFDFRDAAIGFFAALGGVLLIGGSLLMVRRHDTAQLT